MLHTNLNTSSDLVTNSLPLRSEYHYQTSPEEEVIRYRVQSTKGRNWMSIKHTHITHMHTISVGIICTHDVQLL